MGRLIISHRSVANDQIPGVKLEILERLCEGFLTFARSEGWKIGHIIKPEDAKHSIFSSCRPRVCEQVFSRELSSLFSCPSLSDFCSEKLLEPIYLVGVIDKKILDLSLKEADMLGVNLTLSLNKIYVNDPLHTDIMPCSDILGSTVDQSLGERLVLGPIIQNPQKRAEYAQAELSIASIRSAIELRRSSCDESKEELETFQKALAVAEIELFRWKALVGMKLGFIKPPPTDWEN